MNDRDERWSMQALAVVCLLILIVLDVLIAAAMIVWEW
jgi:hypothetical protein